MNSGIETVITSTSGEFFRLYKKYRLNVMGLVHTHISGMPFNKVVDTFKNLYSDNLFFAVDDDESDRLLTESYEYQISGFHIKPIASFYIKSSIERSIARGKNKGSG